MMLPNIIGLTGPAGCGKDTAATLLTNCYDYYAQDSFAAPIYSMVARCLDAPVSELLLRDVKDAPIPWLGVSPRYLVRTLGTDWGRKSIDEQLWVKLMDRRHQMRRGGTVVSDVRFHNEVDWVKENGGLLIALERQDCAPVSAHVSENKEVWAAADVTIQNDYSVRQLGHNLVDQIETWCARR